VGQDLVKKEQDDIFHHSPVKKKMVNAMADMATCERDSINYQRPWSSNSPKIMPTTRTSRDTGILVVIPAGRLKSSHKDVKPSCYRTPGSSSHDLSSQ